LPANLCAHRHCCTHPAGPAASRARVGQSCPMRCWLHCTSRVCFKRNRHHVALVAQPASCCAPAA
jgi:hypothetical protein